MAIQQGTMSLDIEPSPCRICSNATTDIISLSNNAEGISLAEMLRYCVNLEINQYDGLPYQCCNNCKIDLVVAYKLIYRYHQSDTKFREMLADKKANQGNMDQLENDLMPLLAENLIKTELAMDDELLSSGEFVYAEPLLNSEPKLDIKPRVKAEKHNNEEESEDDDDDCDDPDDEDFKCDSYDAIDGDEEDKPKRKRVMHTEPKRCCKCKAKLSTMEEVREHSKTIHEKTRTTDSAKMEARPFECSICFKRYTTKRALRIHKKQLYIENKHQCDTCDLHFKTQSLLEQHHESHEKDVVQLYSNRKGQLPRCCACYEQFDTDELLKKHASDVHYPESLTADDKDNHFACDLCFKRYKSLRILREHHLKPYRMQQYQCATCGRIFRDKHAMADHERTHHDERAFVCPVCAKTFVMKDSFRKHVRAHSLAEDRFKCEVCGKGFKTKANLKGHLITHNPNHRPILCTLCPSTFARKVCLQAHMKLHTGEKPHKCDQCGAAYTFSTDLKRHIMAHQGIKPFVCTICGRGYPRKDYLRKHMANHCNQG